MDYEKEYKKLKAGITNAYLYAHTDSTKAVLESILPELKESEDELKWLTQFIQEEAYSLSLDIRGDEDRIKLTNLQRSLAWLEKQGKKEQDARYEDLEELLAADNIYQMAMNDEMIREAKEKAVNALHGMCIGRLLGIEKQGEQNLIMAKSPQLGEQKPTDKVEPKDYNSIDPHFGKPIDKVEPKFHEGEWAVSKLDEKARQISEVHFDESNSYYVVNGNSVNLEEYDRLHHLWTVQDAKDGDVLTCDSKHGQEIGIVKKYFGKSGGCDKCFETYCFIDWDGIFRVGEYMGSSDIHPATKEEHDTLFAKMKEAGYEFDFEKKELKKIEQKPAENKGMNLVEEEMTPFQKKVFCIIDTTIEEEQGLKQVCDELFALASNEIKQKPAEWSEEDERIYQSIIDDTVQENQLDTKQIDWLKSLKSRVQPKQEWSEEDEAAAKDICDKLNRLSMIYVGNQSIACQEDIKWLKSLKQRYTWKPSEEQMKALAEALSLAKNCGEEGAFDLRTLHEQLEKL